MLRRHLAWLALASALPALAACSGSEARQRISDAFDGTAETVHRFFEPGRGEPVVCAGRLRLTSQPRSCAVDMTGRADWSSGAMDVRDTLPLSECADETPRLISATVDADAGLLRCVYESRRIAVELTRPVPPGIRCAAIGGVDPAGLEAAFDCR